MRLSVDDSNFDWCSLWIIFVDGVLVPYVHSFDTVAGWACIYEGENFVRSNVKGNVEAYRADCLEQ